jgi:hypothetical protein
MSVKLTFSTEELNAIKNTEFFQRKKNITHAVYEYYGSLIDEFKNELTRHSIILPQEINIQNRKISRGENYEGLPYIVLDFPAFFSAKNIFAMRNFFWWGNGFSMHFIISNSFYKKYYKKIEEAKANLEANKFSICVGETPWDHHFRNENYRLISSLKEKDFSRVIKEKKFIKIGADYSFDTKSLLQHQKKNFSALMQIISM